MAQRPRRPGRRKSKAAEIIDPKIARNVRRFCDRGQLTMQTLKDVRFDGRKIDSLPYILKAEILNAFIESKKTQIGSIALHHVREIAIIFGFSGNRAKDIEMISEQLENNGIQISLDVRVPEEDY